MPVYRLTKDAIVELPKTSYADRSIKERGDLQRLLKDNIAVVAPQERQPPYKSVTLEARSRQQWRTWLRKQHASSPGVWLVFYKDHTGLKSIPYEDAVREALCFGWIDSLIKRLDDDRYARKFTPRKPTSNWSDSNRKRWAELKAAGRLAAAGLAAAPTDTTYAPRPAIPDLPAYISKALKSNPKAWRFFQALAPSHRRHYVAWIHSAKRPETRERRIRESIAMLTGGQTLGLK